MNLKMVRADVTAYCEKLLDKEGPYGSYRARIGGRPDLYSSLDIALIRAIMGEDLQALPDNQRLEWINYINSFVNLRRAADDGSYGDIFGHSKLHANGMVIGALSVLGGKQALPVRLYDDFNTADKVTDWLENIDWAKQWSSSHLFWGGMHCFSFSKRCPDNWLDTVIDWLDHHVDANTGWWCKGIPHENRHEPLGGSVHILPIYEHHQRSFPYPEKVIDSVLALQIPSGRWLDRKENEVHVMHYLELDALYALHFMQQLAPHYRKDDIKKCVEKYGQLVSHYHESSKELLYGLHPHYVVSAVGTFGLLQKLCPALFVDTVQWTDIFSDVRLYDTAAVEV